MHFRFIFPSLLLPLATASAVSVKRDVFADWKPPGPTDFRGPCPMLNALTNHGFLRRDGRNITLDAALYALGTALNFEEEFATTVWGAGLVTNPEPNATSWNLDGLGVHDLLEHDASLSRPDAYFGNHRLFNATVFAQTMSYWPNALITREQMSNTKLARMLDSKITNPTYRFTNNAEGFSIGEMVSLFLVFSPGVGEDGEAVASKEWLEFWFENERFPTELGWTPPADPIGFPELEEMDALFRNSSSLITEAFVPEEDEQEDSEAAANASRRARGLGLAFGSGSGSRMLLH